jgi:uncharacterized protein RhaS with RHS repeats
LAAFPTTHNVQVEITSTATSAPRSGRRDHDRSTPNTVNEIVSQSGGTTSTRKFVWCGNDRCEFREANDAVTLFAYAQGQYVGTTKYLYFRDHLGSVREMMRANGTVVARFDYDPWGRSTAVVNTVLPDFNFSGLYRHTVNNLDMAVRHFYDPDFGRWLP